MAFYGSSPSLQDTVFILCKVAPQWINDAGALVHKVWTNKYMTVTLSPAVDATPDANMSEDNDVSVVN